MQINKNMYLFVSLVLLPNLIVWASPILGDQLGFHANDYKIWFLMLLLVSVLGSSIIVYLSLKNKNKIWIISGSIFLIVTLLTTVISYSASKIVF